MHSQGFIKFHTQNVDVKLPKFHTETLYINHLRIGETCETFFLTFFYGTYSQIKKSPSRLKANIKAFELKQFKINSENVRKPAESIIFYRFRRFTHILRVLLIFQRIATTPLAIIIT